MGLLLTAPLAAPAPPRAAAEPSARAVSQEHQAWVARLEIARTRLIRARAAIRESDERYGKTRQRHRLRGETKRELLTEREVEEMELAAAESSWPELLEGARQAGVPPGLLRPFQDAFPEPTEGAPSSVDD